MVAAPSLWRGATTSTSLSSVPGGAQVTKVAPHGAVPVSPLSSVGSEIVSLFWIAIWAWMPLLRTSSPASR